MRKYQQLLFYLLVFLIPTNLAWHLPAEALAKVGWDASSYYVAGVLVDYLIPKFYLSDVPIVLLFLIWLGDVFGGQKNVLKNLQKKITTLIHINVVNLKWVGLILLALVLLVHGWWSTAPLAAFWFWLKFVEMGWLGWYLIKSKIKNQKSKIKDFNSHYTLYSSLYTPMIALAVIGLFDHYPLTLQQGQLMLVFGIALAIQKGPSLKVGPIQKGWTFLTILWPLIISLCLQALFGIYQYISQRSLGGYWLLGETTLVNNRAVSQGVFGGVLKTLPYGTTPHPNVLAGFLVFGITVMIIYIWNNKILIYQKIIYSITFALSLLTLFLTQAVSAWLAFGVVIMIMGWQKTSSKYMKRLLIAVVLFGVSVIFVNREKIINSVSFTRRAELNTIALGMINANPLFGVGLNNFTADMSQYGIVSANTRFLQPVHNIYLLWLAETGILINLVLILTIIKKYYVENY